MMAGPLPPNAEPGQSQTHTLSRDLDAVLRLQVMTQEWSRPHGRPIPHLSRGLLNEPINQRINNLPSSPGPPTARTILEPPEDLQPLALLKTRAPMKDRAPTHPQPLGHFAGTLSFLAPEQ